MTWADEIKDSDTQRSAGRGAVLAAMDVITAVEARCMAVDGPVTPTLKAMTEDELRQIWGFLKDAADILNVSAFRRDS